MTGFIVRRLLSSLLVVILTSMFVFVLFFKGLGDSPGGELLREARAGQVHPDQARRDQAPDGLRQVRRPQLRRSGPRASSSAATNVYMDGKLYDCPAPCLGISITTGDPVWTDLAAEVPRDPDPGRRRRHPLPDRCGVFLGAFAARWRGRTADRLIVGGTLVVSADPRLPDHPAGLDLPLPEAADLPEHRLLPDHREPAKTVAWMMLPWLVIGLTNCTDYARFTRGQMVETLNEDYIRTAQAKGMPTDGVLFKHALRAAIVPVITIFGLDFATLLAGTIFAEQIFGIDGIGHWGLRPCSDPDRHQRHQRHRAGRRGADRGRQPGGRRALRLPRSARRRRVTMPAGTALTSTPAADGR